MQHTLIVPGLSGSGPGHWQDWWLRDHADARLVEIEDLDRPRLDAWLSSLESALASSPGSILVAHSLGAVLVANLADRPSSHHVAGALLVAPSDLELVQKYHPGQVDFGAMPGSRLPFPSILVASRDDRYLCYERARRYADDWGSGLVDLGAAGHINIASGFGRWEDGYALASAFRHRGLQKSTSRAA